MPAGSSPLTRGKPERSTRQRPLHGLIPAHAGKTRRPRRRGTFRWAHPRSRGENLEIANPRGESEGSSPLTRGKLAWRHDEPIGLRLIPAHAGKTHRRRGRDAHHQAHPRSRGENATNRLSQISAGGSSPLTRGKRGRWPHKESCAGLIPAHAGKTGRTHDGR